MGLKMLVAFVLHVLCQQRQQPHALNAHFFFVAEVLFLTSHLPAIPVCRRLWASLHTRATPLRGSGWKCGWRRREQPSFRSVLRRSVHTVALLSHVAPCHQRRIRNVPP